MVIGYLRVITHQRFIKLYHVGVLTAEFVAGAVTADHNVLCHL